MNQGVGGKILMQQTACKISHDTVPLRDNTMSSAGNADIRVTGERKTVDKGAMWGHAGPRSWDRNGPVIVKYCMN
jgi:hypothetical protein